VVDDPEEDDSVAVAAAIGTRRFAIRHLHRRARGVSAARNAGWAAAEAPLVLFLGDDILAAPELVAEHLAWHGRHAGEPVAVLGHVRWARELRTTALMRWLDRGIQFDYGSIAGSDASWAHFYTANVSLPRALLATVDGFDEERYPFLYEDLDIGRRLADHGLRVVYNRRAEAEHLHPTDLEQWKRRMAATAAAERRWVQARPEMPAYFHDRFAEAAAAPAASELAARLARWVPERLPLAGPRVWRSADLWFCQQLAPGFLAAWEAAGSELRSAASWPPRP
jgi:GT2 family glycosyltransferase